MKSTKKIILTAMLVLFLFIPNTFGATTFTISNTNLLPSLGWDTGVAAFIFEFAATADAANDSTTVISAPPQSIFWFATDNINVTHDLLSIGGADGTPPPNSNPLANGEIATTTFNASGLSLVGWEFRDYSQQTITDIQLVSNNMSSTGDGTVSFNAVPIPGSILLLGSGLVGLIGIARRKRS